MESTLRSDLVEFDQEHLLHFLDNFDEDASERLRQQIEAIDLAHLTKLINGVFDMPDWAELAKKATPPQAIRLHGAENRFSRADALARGEQALRDHQIGMLLVAGGQGSRLNFEHAKGLFEIGPVSKRSLLQVLIERQLAVARRYSTRIPLYMMTSPATHKELITFLHEHDRFGLDEADLRVFCQGTMPAVSSTTKKILIAAPGEMALGPNGLAEGMRPDTALFDLSTNSVNVVRDIHARFAEKNLYMLDAPVSAQSEAYEQTFLVSQ